jgi:hypothetical protein
VVVGREVQLGSGYADLVAVEPNGQIVLIEVKLSKNAEARRAVVAQILSYAAVLHGMDRRGLEQEVLGAHLEKRGFGTLADALQEVSSDSEAVEDGIRESLTGGRFRLVLVLDDAPADLVRLVGYLEAVTDGLVIDLITVASYEVGGSRVIVPQRVEPERHRAERAVDGPRRTEQGRLVPGSDDFRAWIEHAPEEHSALLTRVCDWAESLEAEGLVDLSTYHGTHGSMLLLPRLKLSGTGLVTIVGGSGGASIKFWRSLFERRAPGSVEIVERLIAPRALGQGTTTREITEDLLDALTSAYRTAASAVVGG